MGSKPSSTNPNDHLTSTSMSSTQTPQQSSGPPINESLKQNPDTKTSSSPKTLEPKSPDPPLNQENPRNPENENLIDGQGEEGSPKLEGEGEEEEEQGECGFCLFMKGGGCKETFVEWEKCVEEAEKKEENIVDKCFKATTALKECMEAHPEYYSPILQAEKAAEAEVIQELDKVKEKQEFEASRDSEKGQVEEIFSDEKTSS